MVTAALLTALWASIPTARELASGNPSTTAFIELRRAEAAQASRPLVIKWQWRRLNQISPYLRAAVIYAEDARFYDHEGVDWVAIEHAVEANYQRGKMAVGGSTITQQLAKNLYLSPSRSLLRKVRELLIAARLESDLTKPRILELYLNVVEWGDGIFGAEAAARHWFGRSARQLTPAQAARLVVALPNPFLRSPRHRSATLQRKVGRILAMLRRDGLINQESFAAAAAEAGLPPPPPRKATPGTPATTAPAAASAESATTTQEPQTPAPTQPVAPTAEPSTAELVRHGAIDEERTAPLAASPSELRVGQLGRAGRVADGQRARDLRVRGQLAERAPQDQDQAQPEQGSERARGGGVAGGDEDREQDREEHRHGPARQELHRLGRFRRCWAIFIAISSACS